MCTRSRDRSAYSPNDVIAVVQGTNCTLSTINAGGVSVGVGTGIATLAHTLTATTGNNNTATYNATAASLVNLGQGDRFGRTLYAVDPTKTTLTSQTLLPTALAATPVASSVVNLKAQFGLDTDNDGQVDTWQSATGNWSSANLPLQPATAWQQIQAVRVAIVTRSEKYETDAVTAWTARDVLQSGAMRGVDDPYLRSAALSLQGAGNHRPVAECRVERAMNSNSVSRRLAGGRISSKRQQRGLVVFIAMLVMLALALAGIALIRSTDTATRVNGNLVLKHAATSAVDRGIEQTIHALWEASPTLDRTQHDAATNYYACVRGTNGGCLAAGSAVPKIPDLLKSASGCAGAGLASGLVANDAAGNKSCFVIERMCLNTGPAVGSNCNMSTASFGADPGTIHYTGLVRPGDAYYRVTVRVEGPRNTVSYAQSMLR